MAFTIRFTTTRYRPGHTIMLRTSRNPDPVTDSWIDFVQGRFAGDRWEFTLQESEYPAGTKFKFFLDGSWWANDPDLVMASEPDAMYSWDESGVGFQFENRLTEIQVENGLVQQRFFPRAPLRATPWPVIVVGSGMGGGIVANELAHRKRDVLVLEAGGYLFPTHVANLPRQHLLGRFAKHVWDLWDEFEVRNYVNTNGSSYRGGQGYNLGGRSIFWGGLIPRMTELELQSWPEAIRHDLTAHGYDDAEQVMNVRPARNSTFHERVKKRLRESLPELSIEDAPMAVQATPPGRSRIPAGCSPRRTC